MKTKNGKVQFGTMGQVTEIFSNIMRVILETLLNLNFYQLKWLTGHGKELAKVIREAIYSLVKDIRDFPENFVWWRNFYLEEGINVNLSDLKIPEKPKGDWWPIIVAPGMTYAQILRIVRDNLSIWLWEKDIAELIDLSKEQRRAIDAPYIIWAKATSREADPDLKNKSADDIVGRKAITLMEQLLLEVFYCRFINQGTLIKSRTICAGSRSYDGRVPLVFFSSDGNRPTVTLMRSDYNDGFVRRVVSF